MNKSLMIVLSLILLPSGNGIFAQSNDTAESNSRYVLTLNDQHIESLKALGSVQSREIGEEVQGKIAVVQVQFSGSPTDQAVMAPAPIVVQGNACLIELNDSLIELARQQPIRISVPGNSTFARVFLRYSNPDAALESPSAETESALGLGSQVTADAHYVTLAGNERLSGQFDLAEPVKLATKFGEIEIAMGQISGIRFHVDGDDSAVVVLNNGDSITGVPQINSFELNTGWGRAELEAVYIESVTTSPTSIFQQDNTSGNGPRWQLIGG